MNEKHIDFISCGQGSPSLYLIVMAGVGLFRADLVIVADTGWENDMLWNTGERTTAQEFFGQVTKPLANQYGIDAAFVRTLDENGKYYMPIPDAISYKQKFLAGTPEFKSKDYGIDIPLFGSRGGRLQQSCTSKWKIQAIRQELRRRGAETATGAIGLHLDEVHRMKSSDVKWCWNCWPLLDMAENGNGGMHSMGLGKRLRRYNTETELTKLNVPYIITTQCDGCPHKDLERWRRTSQDKIRELAEFETQFNGEYFLTDKRIPLIGALEEMEKAKNSGDSLFDSCDSGYCFL